MCEAIRQMMESSKQQGMQQGIQQGMQRGIQQGIQQGMQRGSREMQLQIAQELLSMNMSVQQVTKATKLTLPEVQQLQTACN